MWINPCLYWMHVFIKSLTWGLFTSVSIKSSGQPRPGGLLFLFLNISDALLQYFCELWTKCQVSLVLLLKLGHKFKSSGPLSEIKCLWTGNRRKTFSPIFSCFFTCSIIVWRVIENTITMEVMVQFGKSVYLNALKLLKYKFSRLNQPLLLT